MEQKDNTRLRVTITLIALLLAGVHLATGFKLDGPTVVLLVVAAIPWLQGLLKSIELFGVKIELESLQAKLDEAAKKIELIEDNAALPGKTDPPPNAPSPASAPSGKGEPAPAGLADEWNVDPNKGQFGGSPANNGRVLEATLRPAAGKRSAATEVILTVRSTDPQRPLTDTVTFYLHPTFGRWKKYDVDVENGIARDKITAWGRFTVGAIADGGATKLELDLRGLGGGPPKFYEQ